MKKLIIILGIVLLAVAGACLVFYKNSLTKQESVDHLQANSGNNGPVVFSMMDEKETRESTVVENYNVGSVEFKIYPGNDPMAHPGYFEVYQKGMKVFSSDPNYVIDGLFSFTLADNRYVVVNDYSGGAHCCQVATLFRINKNDEVKVVKVFDMGNANFTKDNLSFKDNKLYLELTDDSFQYFHTAYVNSYFFQQYLVLEGDQVLLANADFAPQFRKDAEDCKNHLAKAPVQPDDEGNYWLNDLVCYVADYTLIGKQQEALSSFDAYFKKFFPTGAGQDSFDQPITINGLKNEIIDILRENKFQ